MNEQEVSTFITQRIIDGQNNLACILKALAHRDSPELLERVGSNDNHIFLEPTLCAYFHTNHSNVPLGQLLFGYIKNEDKPHSITVTSDEQGTIYIPNLGYYHTELSNQSIRLFWEGQASTCTLAVDSRKVAFKYQEISTISGTCIEVYQTLPPLFKTFFQDPAGQPMETEVTHITKTKRKQLEKACRIIRHHYPAYFENIMAAVRGVLVYQAPYPYSFATMGAHGVAFLNANSNSTPVFFLEDMLHQCAHVIFNAATTLSKNDVFKIDPEAPMSTLSELKDYHGTVYEAFHGLFTQTNINRCLKMCRESSIFSGKLQHEMEGRISDDMKRFGGAIHALDRREFYTELGWKLFSNFRDTFVSLYTDQRELIERYDTSNQPYIFSYEKFLELNHMPEETAAVNSAESG